MLNSIRSEANGNIDEAVMIELAKIEYESHLNQSVCKPQQTTVKEIKHAEMLYQETRLSQLKHKFSRRDPAFWGYSFAIAQYRNEQASVPEQRKLEQVLDLCSNPVQTVWNAWKEDQVLHSVQQASEMLIMHLIQMHFVNALIP